MSRAAFMEFGVCVDKLPELAVAANESRAETRQPTMLFWDSAQKFARGPDVDLTDAFRVDRSRLGIADSIVRQPPGERADEDLAWHRARLQSRCAVHDRPGNEVLGVLSSAGDRLAAVEANPDL
jgi:hypothetical protein